MPKGSDIVIDVLRSENVSCVFGNPGTTELALVDGLSHHLDIKYILGLQEATVVGIADGYARATNRPAFVNLHATAGLGNGLGALSNTAYMNTPMVITAGQQDYRHIVDDPWLTGDLVGLAKPLCKWAHEVRTVDELGTVLRRAFKDANTHPKGPVFVALPSNFMEEETTSTAPPKSVLYTAPVAGGLKQLKDYLIACKPDELAIIAGDEISDSDALQEVVELAEMFGADVYGSALHDSVVFPTSHPLWCGVLKPVAAEIKSSLKSYKKIFLLGARSFMAYIYTPVSPVPDGTEVLHLSADPAAVAMTFEAKWGGVGDIKQSIRELLSSIVADNSFDNERAVTSKIESSRAQKQLAWKEKQSQLEAALGDTPIKPETAAYGLVKALPEDVILVDECPATMWAVREFYQSNLPGQYHFSKGGGLGWAMPAAVGVSLANKGEKSGKKSGKRTFCLIGDGAAMYSPQALWTAASLQLPITYLVFNNAEYGVLKNYLRNTFPENAERDDFIGMDIGSPNIDYLALGHSMGVPGVRIEDANKIHDAVIQSETLNPNGPSIIEIIIASTAEL